MCFIDHDDIVSSQERIDHGFPEKHTIGHVFDSCSLGGLVIKADQIANLIIHVSFDILCTCLYCILASVPNLQFFSSATRSATDVAAIRLGYYNHE